MGRTQGRVDADTPHKGGWILDDAFDVTSDNTTNLVLTRNAAFDWSLNRTATGAETYHIVGHLGNLSRLLESPFLQEQFGTAAGTSGPTLGATAAPGPISVPGVPPFTGANQLVAPTAPPSKGLQIIDVTVIHQVGVVALTSAALLLDKVVFANNVALAKTSIALNAVSIPVATQANPYVTVVPVTTPVFVTDDVSDVIAELTIVMASTGTLRIYGIGFHVNFNFN